LAHQTHLSITQVTLNGEQRLDVVGELDMASAHALLESVEVFERTGGEVLAIDLAGVTFMDVAGMRVLLEAARRAHRRGSRIVIYNPRRIASRVFSLTAVDQQLEISFDEQHAPA
jgi:anti-sigma B factor antagonist